MANIKSQIKRNRQNEKRRLANRIYIGSSRTAVQKARKAMEAGTKEEAQVLALDAIGKLDKATAKGVLHKNNAARRKSRLMKRLAALTK